MFKKIKEFGRKNMTWGGYGKLCVISIVISIVCTIIAYIQMGIIKLPEKKKITDDPTIFEKEVNFE